MEKKNEALKKLYKYNSQNKMLQTNSHISLNTVDVNVLNLPVKRWRQSNWISKIQRLYSLADQD